MAEAKEFFCPYCQLWINDGIHEQHHHNDSDEPDERRDWRSRRVSRDLGGDELRRRDNEHTWARDRAMRRWLSEVEGGE
jgi:hypothetical protein